MTRKVLGRWTVGALLGRGGNADVYRGSAGDSSVALKIYRQSRRPTNGYKRFSDEVEALRRCASIKGVLPLLGQHLPERPSAADPAWFAMPIAEPLEKWVGVSTKLETVVEAVAEIGSTLSEVHTMDMAHRDIKPGNLYRLGHRYAVGDFGLVDFVDKSSLTAEGEKIGPVHYIAPEMLNEAVQADGRPADVYSLAKTLWVLATGQKYPLPGEMRRSEPAFRISTYVNHPRAALLNPLIEMATLFDPRKRPTMERFVAELRTWGEPLKADAQSDTIDLSALSAEIRAANEPFHASQEQQQRYREFILREAARLIGMFRPVMTEIGLAFTEAGLINPRAWVSPPAGVGATFNADGYIVAATWRGEIEVHIRGSLTVNASAEASISVSYSFQVNQDGKTTSINAWQTSGTFFCDGPSEEAEVARIIAEMRRQVRPLVARALSMSRGEEGSPPA